MTQQSEADIAASVVDTPIYRATIDKIPITTLDTWLTVIRDRRLVVVQRLQEVREAKRRAYLTDVAEKYAKMYERVKSNLVKLDDAMEKIETNVSKLRALELELNDEDDDAPVEDEVEA